MMRRRRTWSFLEPPEHGSAIGDAIENVVAWAALIAFIWWACK